MENFDVNPKYENSKFTILTDHSPVYISFRANLDNTYSADDILNLLKVSAWSEVARLHISTSKELKGIYTLGWSNCKTGATENDQRDIDSSLFSVEVITGSQNRWYDFNQLRNENVLYAGELVLKCTSAPHSAEDTTLTCVAIIFQRSDLSHSSGTASY